MQITLDLVKRRSWAHPQRRWLGRTGMGGQYICSSEEPVLTLLVHSSHAEAEFSRLDVRKQNGEGLSENPTFSLFLLWLKSDSCFDFWKCRYVGKHDVLWEFCKFLSPFFLSRISMALVESRADNNRSRTDLPVGWAEALNAPVNVQPCQ